MAILGHYPNQAASVVLYGVNLLLATASILLLWSHADRSHRRMKLTICPPGVQVPYIRTFIGIVVYSIGVSLAAVNPWLSYGVFWLTPVIYAYLQWRKSPG